MSSQVKTQLDYKVIPQLKTGQRLSRVEFEQRYDAYPEIKKAELIEGVVYVAAAVRVIHGNPHFDIIGWLSLYQVNTPGLQGSDNTTLRLDDKNEPQPDVILRLDPAFGGRSRITEDNYLEGPPELIVEVAASSAAFDLTTKRQVYARHGVLEYLVVQTIEQRIDWFVLGEGVYQALPPDESGILRSQVFPGLWLNPTAFWAGDMRAVLATLQQGLTSPEHKGLTSPEHTAFVKRQRSSK